MKRSALALILAVLMTVGLLTIGAAAEPAQTSYVDENGASFEVAAEPVTSELTAWSTGWYVVSSDVEIADRITVSGEVNLILADGCTLNATKGISVTSGNSLTIYGQSGGSGALVAGTDGIADDYYVPMAYYAGIGGNRGNNEVYAHGDITINGGTITAYGGIAAAGIGGGSGISKNTEENGTIIINGGTINATGGTGAAGIGCGSQNGVAGGNITITGGEVTAQGGKNAAGIGGANNDNYTLGRSITISGGTVNATGGSQAAGIGSGYSLNGVNRSISAIKINGSANVTANGGAGAAGIGSSYEGKTTGAIQISGNVKVEAKGGDSAGSILCAGAGIGSGGDGGKVGNITITGGTVKATGGNGSTGGYNFGGAGIGSGGSLSYNSTSNPIVINAGTITATGGTGADGIGSGADSDSGDFSTDRTVKGETVPGKAVIRTNSITDDDDTSNWNAVIFNTKTKDGTVYGDVELGRGFTVAKNETLTVPENSSLTVPEGKKLTVNGTLTNKGQILNFGTIEGTGTITGIDPVNDPEATYTNASGTTYYETIGAAIDASNKNGGGKVTLLKDATLVGIHTAPDSIDREIRLTYIQKTLTLDLGGYTLTCGDPIGFAVDPYVTFTIQNGTYNHTAGKDDYGTAIEGTTHGNNTATIIIAANATVKAAWDGIVADGNTTVNVCGKIESGNVAVYGFGPTNTIKIEGAEIVADGEAMLQAAYDPDASKNRDPSNITIKDSNIKTTAANGIAILISSNEGIANGNHTLNVTSSEITGAHGIVVMGTDATISGDDTKVNAPDGYALAITNNDNGDNSVGTMTINGGTFIGLIEVLEPAAEGTAINMGEGCYLVTTDANDGSTPLESEVIKTSSYTLPEAPTRDGYKFQGWYDGTKLYAAEENVPITGNTTFTARWIKTDAAYSLSLAPASLNLLDVGSGTITVSAEVPEGYELVMTNSNGSVADAVMSEDGKTITVTAENAGSTTISVSIVSEDGVVTLETETCNVVVGPSYAITIVYGNGTGNKTEYIAQGDDYRLPAAPSKPGYIFMGWKCSDGHTHQANEVVPVDSDMTFTAIWANMPDITPGTPGGDDEPVVPDFPFTDVREGQWFYEAVKYVYTEGIMNGMDRYTFAPNGSLTRAMVWTMLARLDGVDTEGGATWYSKAQDWAMSLDVSDGTNPMGEITRQELVTMLWRYAYVCDADMTLGDDTNILSYIDIDKVSDWAVEAFQWCCGAGIIEGDENGALNPTAGCTRAEAAAMFMRLCKNVDLSPTM